MILIMIIMMITRGDRYIGGLRKICRKNAGKLRNNCGKLRKLEKNCGIISYKCRECTHFCWWGKCHKFGHFAISTKFWAGIHMFSNKKVRICMFLGAYWFEKYRILVVKNPKTAKSWRKIGFRKKIWSYVECVFRLKLFPNRNWETTLRRRR